MKRAFKVGDPIAVLHDTIKGTIKAVETNFVKIEDEDGFLRTYKLNEIVLLNSSSEYRIDEVFKVKDRPSKRFTSPVSNTSTKNSLDWAEIDLHIEELVDDHTNLANFEIVRIQMTACSAFIKDSIALGRKKVIIIHGKGEGVLKSEIHAYLERLTNDSGQQFDFHDASYSRYGIGGATEVVFGR